MAYATLLPFGEGLCRIAHQYITIITKKGMPKHPINRRKSQAEFTLVNLSIKKAEETALLKLTKEVNSLLLTPFTYNYTLLFDEPNWWFYIIIFQPFFE